MTKILILGSGVYQVPLIRTVQKSEHKALVVGMPGNYPGIGLADEFPPICTTDIRGVRDLAARERIDAVLTCGSDVGVPTAGAVVDILNLPATGHDASLKSMNKVLMKEELQKAGVATAEFKVVKTLEDALMAV